MKPFSALYFLKNNKAKATMLVALLMLIAVCWLGGVYVTNVSQSVISSYDDMKDFAVVSLNGEADDQKLQEYDNLKTQVQIQNRACVVMGVFNEYILFESIMGFATDKTFLTFSNNDEFQKYNSLHNVLPNGETLNNNEIIISDNIAKMFGLTVGDIMKKDDNNNSWNILNDYKIKKIIPRNSSLGYDAVAVSDSFKTVSRCLLMRQDNGNADRDRAQFKEYVNELSQQFTGISFYSYDNIYKSISTDFDFLNLIYYVVIAIVALVMAIIIGAAISTFYDKRKYEFSVYKAIGISERQIVFKILKEMCIIGIMGLLGMFALSMLAIAILNNFLLIPSGKYLVYFQAEAVICSLLVWAVAIIPSIVYRILKIRKLDITQF